MAGSPAVFFGHELKIFARTTLFISSQKIFKHKTSIISIKGKIQFFKIYSSAACHASFSLEIKEDSK